MISGIKKRIDWKWFNFRCSGIFNTPSIRCDPESNIVVVSQMHHNYMAMYLLAVKSFARYIRPRYFVLVDDGLLDEDKRVLTAHLGKVHFVRRQDVALEACPAGGCWERILTLSHENQSYYTVQLDADTLTLSEPTEVLQCLAENRTFTLGTSTGRHMVGFSEASRFAHEKTNDHIQNHAERMLEKFPGHEHLKYVRGCAGFAGFASGQLPADKIEKFSIEMSKLVGREKWREWGSEQVTSNYMAANAQNALVLPVERYPFWRPDVDIEKAVFVHFFGTFRFTAGMYQRQSARVIQSLLAQ